ncbi:hypothetical protein EYF80_067140 [Liparis tanakae]|uniref:Uncharacterized protein n=1 Tax=Liparis tanakae TaxID=230148 RepID=A0A4Z2E233_9TELE|nr:hypothetical protein EYF80_067140 [Liparis tanakae]
MRQHETTWFQSPVFRFQSLVFRFQSPVFRRRLQVPLLRPLPVQPRFSVTGRCNGSLQARSLEGTITSDVKSILHQGNIWHLLDAILLP